MNPAHLGTGLLVGSIALAIVQMFVTYCRDKAKPLTESEFKQVSDYVDQHADKHIKPNKEEWGRSALLKATTKIINSKEFKEDPEATIRRKKSEIALNKDIFVDDKEYAEDYFNFYTGICDLLSEALKECRKKEIDGKTPFNSKEKRELQTLVSTHRITVTEELERALKDEEAGAFSWVQRFGTEQALVKCIQEQLDLFCLNPEGHIASLRQSKLSVNHLNQQQLLTDGVDRAEAHKNNTILQNAIADFFAMALQKIRG